MKYKAAQKTVNKEKDAFGSRGSRHGPLSKEPQNKTTIRPASITRS